MEKTRINLVSGSVYEKPLLTAFVNGTNTYVIFDNEVTGSMGLPIILVSKLVNDKLQKIEDKSVEWEETKNCLRSIINSEDIKYVNIPEEVRADDTFFTQLTLPIASFDALKNNYVVAENQNNEVQSNDMTSTAVNANQVDGSGEYSVQSEEDSKEGVTIEHSNETIEEEQQKEVTFDELANETHEVVDEEIHEQKSINIELEKEAFLKACENMFDALVSKLK